MPLKKSSSKAAVSSNIREMVASGRPQKQAVAAALSNQRRMKAKGFQMGGSVTEHGYPKDTDIPLPSLKKGETGPQSGTSLPRVAPASPPGKPAPVGTTFTKKGGTVKRRK